MKIGDYIVEEWKGRCFIARIRDFHNDEPLTDRLVLVYKNYGLGVPAEDWEDVAKYLRDCLESRPTKRAADQPKTVAQDWVDGKLVTFCDEGGPYKSAGG